MYGVIENVSDRPYVSNSFHCHVTEDITPIQKQDLEGRFWDLCNGGKIQYVRYPMTTIKMQSGHWSEGQWIKDSMKV